jgi:hypothetical protein
MQDKIIDVEKILKTSFPKSKYLPKPIINFLKRYLFEKELNDIVEANRDLQGFDWVNGILHYFNITLEVNHEQYASLPGRYIFVPNHNLGGLDGLAVFSIIARYHKTAKSLSNDYLLLIPNTRSLIIPVSRKSNSTKEFLSKVDEYYASDEQMLVFPAGFVARKKKGIVQDPEWTKSFVAKAIQHKRWIVPVYMDTKNQTSFYRNYKYRKLISKITGLNIERFFLLRQSFTHYNNTFKMNFGKPFSYEIFDKSRDHHQWAQAVREHVYKLGMNNDIEFKG